MQIYFKDNKNELSIKYYLPKFALLTISLFSPVISRAEITGENHLQAKNEEIRSQIKNDLIQTKYLLGPGDSLFIEFRGIPELTNEYTIDPKGDLYLPEINKINAKGTSIDEFKNILIEKYQDHLISPDINLYVSRYRPVKVFLSGELIRPGLYTLDNKQTLSQNSIYRKKDDDEAIAQQSFLSQTNKSLSSPTIYDAIKRAGGITRYSDLSNIIITRKNAKSLGGGYIQTKIDLIPMLMGEISSANITLFDGDIINISKDNLLITEQIIRASKSNINPEFLTVLVSGQAENTGGLSIYNGATLNQAIATAGGKKLFSGKIEFIRFKSDGTVIRRKFKYDPEETAGEYKNPILVGGDIIDIKRSPLGYATDTITTLTRPIVGIFSIYSLYDTATDN